MAAKVDGTRIPDHPPYSLMIGEAIRSLNEEHGSTESSISEYIKGNFGGLPWGHDRLLPYYLNKLVAQGEFVNGATDRYLLAGDDDCDAQEEKIVTLSPKNIKSRGKFVRKKSSKHEVGTKPLQTIASTPIEPEINDRNLDEDEGVPLACEGDLVIEVQPLVKPETYKSHAFDENSKLAANSSGEVILKSMSKRRGRPPKRNQSPVGGSAIVSKPIALNSMSKRLSGPPKTQNTDVEMVQATNTSSLSPLNIDVMKNPTENQTNNVSVPKKLGRPPKSKHVDPNCNVEIQKGQTESDPIPKHRRKPSKSKLELVANNIESNLATETSGKSEEKNSTCVPKRRGRPPKSKIESEVDTSQF